jgi:hypothetical protein
VASGGKVSVFETVAIDGHTDAELIQQFRKARTTDYEALAGQIRDAAEHLAKRADRRAPGARERILGGFRERFIEIHRRGYFAAAGRALVEQVLRNLESSHGIAAGTKPGRTLQPRAFQHRTWVTRSRPGIDRLASAWLI